MGYGRLLTNREKSKKLTRIVAHLMGDGCVTHRYFAYYNKNPLLLYSYEKDVKSLFPQAHIIKGKNKSGTFLIQIQNKVIIEFLKSLLKDYRSNSLIIPKFIVTKELQREFLQAFFDDEGCVALRVFKKTNEIKRNLTLSSNSLRFIEEVKQVLNKSFDITSNKIAKYIKIKNSRKYVNYVLSITGKSNFEKFRNEIGFFHPEKKKKLNLMINSYIRLKSTT